VRVDANAFGSKY
jgi:hypothetical protein